MQPMTKMERVRAAVEGRALDRVPLCFWHHFKPEGSPQMLARMTDEFFSAYDLDIFKIMPDIRYPFPNDSIRSADDWSLIADLEPYQGDLGRILDTIEILRDRTGPETPIIVTLFSPLAYAIRFAGAELVAQHMSSNPVQLHQALATLAGNLRLFNEAAIETGADGIFFATHGAGDNLYSDLQYAEFGRPYDLMALAGASKGWLTTLHVHASSDLNIDPFLSYPAPVLSWSDRVTGISLAKVRGKAPDKCLMGGIDESGAITTGTKEQIRKEIEDAIDQVAGHRFILANGCSIPDDNPEHLLRAAREALDELS
jgi:uroporphyrinogen decarboxylase